LRRTTRAHKKTTIPKADLVRAIGVIEQLKRKSTEPEDCKHFEFLTQLVKMAVRKYVNEEQAHSEMMDNLSLGLERAEGNNNDSKSAMIETHNYIVETFVQEDTKRAMRSRDASSPKCNNRQSTIARGGRPTTGGGAGRRSPTIVAMTKFDWAQKRLQEMTASMGQSLTVDVFELSDITNGKPILFTGMTLLEEHGLLSFFDIPRERISSCLTVIESGYREDVPYHNAIHAVDACATLNYMLVASLIQRLNMNEEEVFASIISALIHDYKHPGVNNHFLCATKHELALRYNDQAPLENMHVSEAFKDLTTGKHNLFAGFKPEQYNQIRAQIITMVLGTDMSVHFVNMAKFKAQVVETEEADCTNHATKQMVLKTALHVADIGNAFKDMPVYLQWNSRILEEFYCQGDVERERGMLVSPLCDRHTDSPERCFIGFIDFVCKPFFDMWFKFLDDRTIMVAAQSNLQANRKHWQDELDNRQAGEAGIDSSLGSSGPKLGPLVTDLKVLITPTETVSTTVVAPMSPLVRDQSVASLGVLPIAEEAEAEAEDSEDGEPTL
jgi:hypothetical protein